MMERYHAPDCAGWTVKREDPFTVVSFHERMVEERPAESSLFWMHVGFYMLYVPIRTGDAVPHAWTIF